MKSLLNAYCGSAAIDEGKALLAADRQRRYSCKQDAAGRTVLSAKYSDHFNFVDAARLVIGVSGIDSASCGCPAFTREKGLCCHCAALLLKYEEEVQEPILAHATAWADTAPEAAPEESPKAAETAEEPAKPETAPDADANADGSGRTAKGILDYSFRFHNTQEDLFPGVSHPVLSLESFETIFGKTPAAKILYQRYKVWAGSCYGFAATAGMFGYPDDILVSDFRADANRPIDLALSDRNGKLSLSLHQFIETMFVSQLDIYINTYRKFMSDLPLQERLGMLTEAVEAFEQGGEPVVIGFFDGNNGHAVFPYRHEKLDASRSRIHIYDSNYPKEVRYMKLLRDESGHYQSWRFTMQKGKDYSSETNCTIDFIPYQIYRIPWDNRFSHEDAAPKALFSTPCRDITVRDESGNDVIKIAAGCLTPFSEDVVPIRITDGEAAADRFDVWIDQGRYHVINDDPERDLEFSYAGNKVGLEVQTDAREVIAEVRDKEQIQKIRIVPAEEKKSKASKILTTLLDVTKQIFIRVVSSYLGGVVPVLIGSLAGKLFLSGLTYDNVAEFTIDGQPANVRDHITLEEGERVENEVAEEADAYETIDDSYQEIDNEDALFIMNKKPDPEQ